MWIDIVLALCMAALLRWLVVLPVCVRGRSMCETLHNGDRLIALKLPARLGRLRRGDIVICRYPGERRYCIKRLTGLPGDVLEMREGELYADGVRLCEEYVVHKSRRDFEPVALKPGQYFVLGDNRANSRDSRKVGPLYAHNICAVAVVRVWPLARAGRLR